MTAEDELAAELRNGTRLVVYHYTISLLILSSRRPSEVFLMRRGQSRLAKGMRYTLLSLLLGWWGLPWGPIFTVWSVIENLAGGEDVTDKVQESMRQKAGTRSGSMPRPPASSPRHEWRSSGDYCKRCGSALIGPGGPCRKCDDVKTIACSACGCYSPANNEACVYCGADLK
jgi:hypothetical protein